MAAGVGVATFATEACGLSDNFKLVSELVPLTVISLWLKALGVCIVARGSGGAFDDSVLSLKRKLVVGEAIRDGSFEMDLLAGGRATIEVGVATAGVLLAAPNLIETESSPLFADAVAAIFLAVGSVGIVFAVAAPDLAVAPCVGIVSDFGDASNFGNAARLDD